VISFVVPAYNEEQLLGPTLRAIHAAARAAGEPYEVVVADDASTDRTAAVAAEHGARVVSVAHRKISATRNAGARAAAGDLLIFVDADTLVTAAVVRAAVRAVHRGAVGGGCRFRFDGRVPLYARLMLPVALAVYRAAGLASGCFLFCTRAAFEAVGGFDEGALAGEEAWMSRALGRVGRFVVLRECVTTSGRKLRSYSWRELLSAVRAGTTRRSPATADRAGLELWYGERRPDPATDFPHLPASTR
jgi:glycosyltransferase involved in cell wall biosynthesis